MAIDGKDASTGTYEPWMSVENRYRWKFRDLPKSKSDSIINEKRLQI